MVFGFRGYIVCVHVLVCVYVVYILCNDLIYDDYRKYSSVSAVLPGFGAQG